MAIAVGQEVVCSKCGASGHNARTCGRLDVPWEADVESRVIVHSLGPLTAREIGRLFGLSASRVEQIEQRAIEKLTRDGHVLQRLVREVCDQ